MDRLLEHFCRYVKIETTACEDSTTYPSTPSQIELSKLLRDELAAVGLDDVQLSEHGIVTATVPATNGQAGPVIAWFAHVDTSPEFTAKNVKPVIHAHYDGRDIILPGDTSRVIKVADNPDLTPCTGKTLITTDGTTLLGADDKSGCAIIMEAVTRLMEDRSIQHGPIRVCYTCDEEIGHGVDKVDLKQLGADVAYTLDGEAQGQIEHETFSADLATVTVTGVNTHPGYAHHKMVNAIRILSNFIHRLPWKELSPETTAGRDGFMHPYVIEGGVQQAKAKILLRDFVTDKLADQAETLHKIAAELSTEHPAAAIDVGIIKQYRNMGEGLTAEPRAVAHAVAAFQAIGIQPQMSIIRGGTDGSRLTELGLPTPNLSAGMHNFHSPLEWACLEEMETAVKMLIELAKAWGTESG